MLHIYFLQLWFNLSDLAVEEAFYDSTAMRRVERETIVWSRIKRGAFSKAAVRHDFHTEI
jgi:hypothetical protein